MKVRHEHVIDAPIEKVMESYAGKDFYIAKMKNSGALTVDVVEWKEAPDGTVKRKVRASEPSRIPAFLRKNDVDSYDDDSVFDPKARTLAWKVTPTIMADKFFLSGLVEFIPQGTGTKVAFNTELVVKIPLIGGKAESIGLEKTQEEVNRQVAFLKKWIAEH
jgi:hypothetical protein